MLNPRGGAECDLPIARLAPDLFFIATGSAFGVHDFTWIRRYLPTDGSVAARDVTTDLACIGLWGPRAREILAEVSADDVSNGAFPYMTYLEIRIVGYTVRVLCVYTVG